MHSVMGNVCGEVRASVFDSVALKKGLQSVAQTHSCIYLAIAGTEVRSTLQLLYFRQNLTKYNLFLELDGPKHIP